MPRITPHLWYDTQAIEAAERYVTIFPDSRLIDVTTIHDTPSGDADIVTLELAGQPFLTLNAGPLFTFNPSVSFMVRCSDADEVDAYWRALSDGGRELMPVDAYPFSARYGWTEDRYGLSWQVMLADEPAAQRITPMLLFVGDVAGRAEEAIKQYTSVFPDSSTGDVQRWGSAEQPEVEGTIKFAAFRLAGHAFAAMDSARDHGFVFNEAISFVIPCETQDEIDRYWDALSSAPEFEQCGWLKDRFGVSWQVTPTVMDDMLRQGTDEQRARVTQAFLGMKKLDIAALEQAYGGAPSAREDRS